MNDKPTLTKFSLLSVLDSQRVESQLILTRLREQGASTEGPNGIYYRLGVMTGISMAETIVLKLSNPEPGSPSAELPPECKEWPKVMPPTAESEADPNKPKGASPLEQAKLELMAQVMEGIRICRQTAGTGNLAPVLEWAERIRKLTHP
jgi:hypothetical protein